MCLCYRYYLVFDLDVYNLDFDSDSASNLGFDLGYDFSVFEAFVYS